MEALASECRQRSGADLVFSSEVAAKERLDPRGYSSGKYSSPAGPGPLEAGDFPSCGEAVADAEILTTFLKASTKRLRPAAFPAYSNFSDRWFEGGSVLSSKGELSLRPRHRGFFGGHGGHGGRPPPCET
jgi:hypothetical protein